MRTKFLLPALSVLASTSLCFADVDITSEFSPGGRSITAFDRFGQRSVGGYFDTEFYNLDDGTQTFKAHHFVLETSSQVHERVLVNAEIEFEYGAQLEGDAETTGEMNIEQAWADIELTTNNYFRTGIVVVPFGIVNVLHDSDIRDTTNRPIYAKYVVPSTWMDVGTGAYGTIDIGEYEINYDAYVMNGLASGISSTDGLKKAKPSLKEDNNQAMAFAGRLAISPFLGLKTGISIYNGKYSDNNEDGVTLYGLDSFYKRGPFEFMAEYAKAKIDNMNNMNGYYGEVRYHFFPKFLDNTFLTRGFAHPTFTLFSRYSAVNLDENVKSTDDKTQITLGINYRPMETVALKLEGEILTENGSRTNSSGIISSVAIGF